MKSAGIGKGDTDVTSLLPRPVSLTVTAGDAEGEIDLVWEPVKGANTYVIQKGVGHRKPARWINEDIVTKSSYTISKLKSRHKYWFRIAAVCSLGQSKWSDPVQKQAP